MSAGISHKIRPATAADLDDLLSIAASSPETPQWRPADYAPYLTFDASNRSLLRIAFVAFSEAHPSGQIVAFVAATLLIDGEQNLCQLDSLAVDPAARRKGIGSELVSAMLSWAGQNSAHRLILEVRASNAAAIRLYQRCGLKEEGRRTRYYTHPEEDALLLGMQVTPAPPHSGFPPEK